MSEMRVRQLSNYLQEWESQYLEVQPQLNLSDLYVLWLRLFRLSRRLIKDYNLLIRSGTIPPDPIAYTGETERLV